MANVAKEAHVANETGQCGAVRRSLVLHADDFGMNSHVSAGILRGFSHGLLTSTAILANAPGVDGALAQWRDLQCRLVHDDLPSLAARRRLADSPAPFDFGIHLNLTQGRPLTGEKYPGQLLDSSGKFPGIFGLAARLLAFGRRFCGPIRDELSAQIEVLLDFGIAPTHLNSHQYIDLLPTVAASIPGLLRQYAIPVVRVPWERKLAQTTLLRRLEPANWCLAQVKRIFAFHRLVEVHRRGVPHPAAFFGTSHAGRIDLDLMQVFVAAASTGVTEIGMHPGASASTSAALADADGWYDPLAAARVGELSLLTSPELVDLLERHHVRLGRLSHLNCRRAAHAAA